MRDTVIGRSFARLRRASRGHGDEFRNELEIQVFGLRRSGNHGLIAWMAQQYPAPVVFLNNARPFTDPFTNHMLGKVPNAVPVRRLSPQQIQKLRRRRKPLLIVSYEDLRLPKLSRGTPIADHDSTVGTSRSVRRALLLRDFYNWLASRVRLFESRAESDEAVVHRTASHMRLWIQYAGEFVGETSELGPNVVKVQFNAWAHDAGYRARIAEQLTIPLSNNTRATVPKTGGGSSFDGMAYSGEADSMDLHNRWKYLQDRKYAPLLQIVNRNRECIEKYNLRIFNMPFPF